jgi:hypothetical protein
MATAHEIVQSCSRMREVESIDNTLSQTTLQHVHALLTRERHRVSQLATSTREKVSRAELRGGVYSLRVKCAIVEAYGNFCRRYTRVLPQRPARTSNHVCVNNPGCVLFSSGTNSILKNVFICEQSGNLHVCLPGICTFTTSNHERDACELTAQVSELDFVRSGSFDDRPRYGKSLKKVRRPGPLIQLQGSELQKRMADDKLAGVHITVPIRVKQARMATMGDIHNPRTRRIRTSMFAKTITQVLTNNSMPPSEAHVSRLVDVVESTWRLVATTYPYKCNSLSYKVEYHCVLVLFNARRGFHISIANPDTGLMERVWIVKPDDFVLSNMPKRTECPGYITRTVTATERMFLTFIRACSWKDIHENLSLYNQRLQYNVHMYTFLCANTHGRFALIKALLCVKLLCLSISCQVGARHILELPLTQWNEFSYTIDKMAHHLV